MAVKPDEFVDLVQQEIEKYRPIEQIEDRSPWPDLCQYSLWDLQEHVKAKCGFSAGGKGFNIHVPNEFSRYSVSILYLFDLVPGLDQSVVVQNTKPKGSLELHRDDAQVQLAARWELESETLEFFTQFERCNCLSEQEIEQIRKLPLKQGIEHLFKALYKTG